MREPYLGTISLGAPNEIVQLQVADLVAYELRQIVTQRIQGRPDFRWPLQRIMKSRHDLKIIHYRGVEEQI